MRGRIASWPLFLNTLAHLLLDSIDRRSGSELEALWLQEAERRASEIDSGAAALVEGTEVARKARALVR